MPKRNDFLENLSPDDPYFRPAKRFHHKTAADAFALEAEAMAGRASFSDFIDGCVHLYEHTAESLVDIQNETAIKARCKKRDSLAKLFIRKTKAQIAKQYEHLGEATVTAASDDFSRRVLEVSARSKQQIHERALAKYAPSQDPMPAGIEQLNEGFRDDAELKRTPNKLSVQKGSLKPKTRKRKDILEHLAQNPRHRDVRRSLLKAWEDSHELVAEAHAGRSSLRVYIDGCVHTFARGAKIQLALRDGASVLAKCKEIDLMARKFTKRFMKSLAPYSALLGEGNLATVEDEFSARVGEIASRSKKKLMRAELRRDSAARGVGGHRGRSPKTINTKPTTVSRESTADDFSTEAGRGKAIASYTERWTEKLGKCSDASLARSARVHPADLCKWKKSMLPSGSEKKERIEDALRDDTPPIPPVRADPNL